MTLGKILSNTIKLWSKYGGTFLLGALKTVQLSLVTVLLGVILGSFLALLKMSGFKIGKWRPLNALASLYIEIVRGTPLLLQLYFFYFFLPAALPSLHFTKVSSVVTALVLNSAAYVAEIVRAGIAAVDMGQAEAARSLGLSGGQAMQKVVLPQAVKNILPALGNELIMMIKETSLAATFFVGELMTKSNEISGATFLQIECLIIVGLLYLVMTTAISKLVGLYERRMKASD